MTVSRCTVPLDSKIMYFYVSYFPLMQDKKVPFHAKLIENNIYFSRNLYKALML